MKEKQEEIFNNLEEMKEIFNKLTDENKDIINMVAKGMELAQNNERKDN